MIVRIILEGQYELSDGLSERLNELDNKLVEVVESGDEDEFRSTFREMIKLVRSGRRLEESQLVPSDVVIPDADSTLEDVREIFVGEGLVPG